MVPRTAAAKQDFQSFFNSNFRFIGVFSLVFDHPARLSAAAFVLIVRRV
ncbi:hypothetical protein RR42_m2500 [Cupriavidus basilensis]|uniref:Uncharacterized protein n=1 Tax=Cupriavidus basilensis TaxID=68895 RepID=A0A0C4Y3R0_9BURK|nr:hypothetical protein RR42_m2500 [Cupriavidus basilensis]